jgi:Methyltransferase domain
MPVVVVLLRSRPPPALRRHLSKRCCFCPGISTRTLLVAALVTTCMSPPPLAASFSSAPSSSRRLLVHGASPHPRQQQPNEGAADADADADASLPLLNSQTGALNISSDPPQGVLSGDRDNGASSASPFVAAPPPPLGSPAPSDVAANDGSARTNSKNKRVVYGSDDALFGCIERQQLSFGDSPKQRKFGSVLDAGTGLHSLRWLASLRENPTKYGLMDVVGVTADLAMQQSVQREADALGIDDISTIVIGNWFDATHPLTFPTESFDTILVDYLVGAMDGFSPYRQDQMIPKLCRFLKPGGSLFVVGMEPLPDSVSPSTSFANVVCRVRQVRDACILLAGHRCYREYPLEWMLRHLKEACAQDLEHVEAFRFPILYRYETIQKQIDVGRSKLSLIKPQALQAGMRAALDELDEECRAACAGGTRISLGFDYVVSATKKKAGSASEIAVDR